MSKFNVGDKVKVRKDLVVAEKYNNIIFTSYMEKLACANKVYTIKLVENDTVTLENDLFWWGEDMLEPVETIKEGEKPEMVNHPQHYAFKYEPIDVINDWGLDFNLGNTVKYIARCERKGNKIQDLEKAKFYLEDEIRRLKENE